MGREKKILLLTAVPLSHSAGLGQDIVNALHDAGFHVDVITKESYYRQPDYVKGIIPFSYIRHLKKALLRYKVIKWVNNLISRLSGRTAPAGAPTSFLYDNEGQPAVSIPSLLSKINGRYDAVITLFWHYFLTTESLRAIYRQLRCPIIIYAVDMAPITGGCFYFGNCRRMFDGCGRCPELNSETLEDPSRRNFSIKRKNYAEMDCVFMANSWMNNFARQTHLFDNNKIETCSIVLDDKVFTAKQKDDERGRKSDNSDFIILLRTPANAGDSVRKGGKYQVEILQRLYDELTDEERSRIGVMTVGPLMDPSRRESLKFKVKELGNVDRNELIKAYHTASVFLSTSVDDAGPSMVNQSMMCGTPVACFNIGTAIDVIEDGVSGIKAAAGDITPIVDGLKRMIRDSQFKDILSAGALKSAQTRNTYKVFSDKIVEIVDSCSGRNKE